MLSAALFSAVLLAAPDVVLADATTDAIKRDLDAGWLVICGGKLQC